MIRTSPPPACMASWYEDQTEEPLNYSVKLEPLDLSCKKDCKLLKRREQNKAAAQTYRRRKKSISEWIESEFEESQRRNQDLIMCRQELSQKVAVFNGSCPDMLCSLVPP